LFEHKTFAKSKILKFKFKAKTRLAPTCQQLFSLTQN